MKILNGVKQYWWMIFQTTRSMDKIAPTFPEELNAICNRVIVFGTFLSLTWLLYIPLDKTLHPYFSLVLMLRIGLPVLGMSLLLTRLFPNLMKYSLSLSTLFVGYLELSAAIITALYGKLNAYIGGFLFVIAILAYIPLERKWIYRFLFSSVIIYISISIYLGMDFTGYKANYVLNDLLSITIITAVFTYILDSIRKINWSRGLQLENDQRIIEMQTEELEQQIKMAGELQRSLLPSNIPKINNAEVAYQYRPMMELGGDFVDVLYDQNKNMLGLFVCDVSGHGVAAAFISSMVKMALNRWNNTLERPADTIRSIHALLRGKIGLNFVTLCVCVIDLKSGKMTCANAGHHPTVIKRASGEIEEHTGKGKLLVDFLEPDCEQTNTILNDGDTVILYTDGILESVDSDNKLFGEESFIKLLKQNVNLSPALLCDEIIDEVIDYGKGREPEDDITVLVSQYRK